MCCRLVVYPLDKSIAEAILVTGEFVRPEGSTSWKRWIPEEGALVTASFTTDGQTEVLRLEISPAISVYAQHATKRITGGVYFETACKYAEKVGGSVIQLSNVEGCMPDGNSRHLLAVYPERPLDWLSVCSGFQEAILGGHHHSHDDPPAEDPQN